MLRTSFNTIAAGRGLANWILGFGALVIVLVGSHGFWFYQQQHTAALDRTLIESQNLVRALEEYTSSTVQWTDYSLSSVADELETLLADGPASPGEIRETLAEADRDTPDVTAFAFADANGRILTGAGEADSDINIADERYFRDAASSDDRTIHVIAQRWAPGGVKLVIGLVRPIRGTDGSLAGILIATIDPEFFQHIHERLELGANSFIAVLSPDGRMLARAPYRSEFIGAQFKDITLFRNSVRSEGGHYTSGQRDGVVRYAAYRVLSEVPLIVVLGRAADEVLAPLRRSTLVAATYFAAFVLLMAVVSFVIVTMARRQERANAHLVSTFESINQGIAVFDTDFRLVSCNERYLEMFDLPRIFGSQGTNYGDILRYLGEHGEYGSQPIDDVIASRIKGLTGGGPLRLLHRRPNSRTIAIDGRAMPAGGFIITFSDITDEVRARKEAEAKSAQLELVLNSIQQGIRVFDKDLKLALTNRQIVDIYGYPEDYARLGVSYEETVRIAIALGEYGRGDSENMVDERVGWARSGYSNGSIRRTPSGRYVKKRRDPIAGGGFIATFSDVTELIETQEELARKTALLEVTQESMGDGLSVYDAELRLINFNRRWVEIWDMPRPLTRIGTRYQDIMRRQIALRFNNTAEDPEAIIDSRLRDIATGQEATSELALPDGRTILLRRYTAPNGALVFCHTDITRLKKAETEAARKSALLETMLDNMAQGIMVVDSDFRVVTYNARFLDLNGYRPEEMWIGMTYEDVLRLAVRRENIRTDDLDAFIAERVGSARREERFRREYQAYSGRYITLRRTPMAGGGFVTTAMDVTDRKKAELALQASEERYRSLVTSSGQIVWTADADGRVVEPLPCWQSFTGQSDVEIAGFGWLSAIHPDDREHCRVTWLSAVTNRSLYNVDYRLRRHDGVYRTFAVRGVPILKDDGNTREWVGVCEDITERRAAENEITAKTDLLEATLQNMAQGITVYDSDQRLTAFNERYIELLDVPPSVVRLGMTSSELLGYLAERGDFGPDAENQVALRIEAARQGLTSQREVIVGTGRTLVVSHTAMPSGGRINTFTDISDRKRAEQALRESEEQLRAILDNIADAVITADRAGAIQSFNSAAVAIFGYQPGEAVHLTLTELIPDIAGHGTRQSPRQDDGHATGRKHDILGRRKDGSLFPLDVAITSVELPGRWLQIAIVRDIGEQKVLQAQLLQASKLATLGEMVAGMAHEMNQPLNVMRMAADNALVRITRNLASEDYLSNTLSLISTQTERLGKLILHMRVFSRVDPTDFELFDPRRSVVGATELMDHQMEFCRIRLTMALPDECPACLGRPSQLEQVLINLLSNAKDAILECPRPQSDGIIGNVAVSMTADADTVRITVKDSGCGIPPGVKERIFDPFFTTKDVGKGTGLGLSVSYGIVTSMNGHFDVATHADGSTFTVVLPASRESLGAPSSSAAEAS